MGFEELIICSTCFLLYPICRLLRDPPIALNKLDDISFLLEASLYIWLKIKTLSCLSFWEETGCEQACGGGDIWQTYN